MFEIPCTKQYLVKVDGRLEAVFTSDKASDAFGYSYELRDKLALPAIVEEIDVEVRWYTFEDQRADELGRRTFFLYWLERGPVVADSRQTVIETSDGPRVARSQIFHCVPDTRIRPGDVEGLPPWQTDKPATTRRRD